MSSERTIKVGIYGAGGHARNNHLINLMRLEEVEVVAVCDIVEENVSTSGSCRLWDFENLYRRS